MVIVGIDPGYAIVGYGVVQYDNFKFRPIGYGAITTEAGLPFEQRLMIIDNQMTLLLRKVKPDAISLEKLFFTNNKTTGIAVAEARGVILLRAAKEGVPVYEYTPMQVKQAITGYGKAEKRQVMEMTKMVLGLKEIPKPDDAADALAMAVCHGHCAASGIDKIRSEVFGR